MGRPANKRQETELIAGIIFHYPQRRSNMERRLVFRGRRIMALRSLKMGDIPPVLSISPFRNTIQAGMKKASFAVLFF
jgi:hypothetical protein